MTVSFKLQHRVGVFTLIATDGVEQRDVRSIEDVRQLLADWGETLADAQHHGLGLITAVFALQEYGDRHGPDQFGKLLDAIYFPATRRAAGESFTRGMGEGTFLLRRSNDAATAVEELIESARRDLEGDEATS